MCCNLVDDNLAGDPPKAYIYMKNGVIIAIIIVVIIIIMIIVLVFCLQMLPCPCKAILLW